MTRIIKTRKPTMSEGRQQFGNALDRFNAALTFGYTDHGFAEAAEAFKVLRDWLDPADCEAIGNLWRNMYTANPDEIPAIRDEIYSLCEKSFNDR